MSPALRTVRVVDDSGQREKFGTNAELGALQSIHVDGEAQAVIFQIELDAAAALGKTIAFADDQGAGALEKVQDFGKLVIFTAAEENHLASFQVRKFTDAADHNVAIIDFLSADNLIKGAVIGIESEDADGHGSFFVAGRVGRPFDEFGEVEKKSGFELILAEGIGLGPDGGGGRRAEQEGAEDSQEGRTSGGGGR
jgi:hypothetical protein